MESVLIFCPVHPEKGIHPLAHRAISGINYPRRNVLYSYGDNPFSGFDPITDARINILHNYEKARDIFLSGSWDYLLTVESDMIVPGDIISRLIATGADVAYSLYVFRRSKRWSAYTIFEPGWGMSISQMPEIAIGNFGKVMDVEGLGLGATLIRRSVLEAIPFHGYHGTACDGWFALDVKKKGFSQKCDLGCISGHIHENAILLPNIKMPNLVEVQVL